MKSSSQPSISTNPLGGSSPTPLLPPPASPQSYVCSTGSPQHSLQGGPGRKPSPLQPSPCSWAQSWLQGAKQTWPPLSQVLTLTTNQTALLHLSLAASSSSFWPLNHGLQQGYNSDWDREIRGPFRISFRFSSFFRRFSSSLRAFWKGSVLEMNWGTDRQV